jgi:hypothetical protein
MPIGSHEVAAVGLKMMRIDSLNSPSFGKHTT